MNRSLKDETTPTLKRRISDLKAAADSGTITVGAAVRAIHAIEDVLHERELFNAEEGQTADPAHDKAVDRGSE